MKKVEKLKLKKYLSSSYFLFIRLYINVIAIIIMKRRKPIHTNTPIILQSHANVGNNDIIPAPIKPTPINPPKEIEDPSDKKPDDWDERAKIPDASAVKPEDW